MTKPLENYYYEVKEELKKSRSCEKQGDLSVLVN